MNKAALSLLLLSCTNTHKAGYQGPPKEITSFSLNRNILWASPDPSRDSFVLVDTQVVRVLDHSGDEIWGRRLSIGDLRAATFCSKGIVVLGSTGAAFLTTDGLLQSWPFPSPINPKWVTRSASGECLFDTVKNTLGSWKEGEAWFASNGAITIKLQEKTLSSPTWKTATHCPNSCPVAIWNHQILVAEPKKIAIFSLQDGARKETEIGTGEGAILSLAASGDALVLSRDDGSVQVWQVQP